MGVWWTAAAVDHHTHRFLQLAVELRGAWFASNNVDELTRACGLVTAAWVRREGTGACVRVSDGLDHLFPRQYSRQCYRTSVQKQESPRDLLQRQRSSFCPTLPDVSISHQVHFDFGRIRSESRGHIPDDVDDVSTHEGYAVGRIVSRSVGRHNCRGEGMSALCILENEKKMVHICQSTSFPPSHCTSAQVRTDTRRR